MLRGGVFVFVMGLEISSDLYVINPVSSIYIRSHLKNSRSQLRARRRPIQKRSPPEADEHFSEARNPPAADRRLSDAFLR